MDKDIWVFGYGSLMWDPGFDFLERWPALLRGYHRAFCIYSHHYRGTPARPGLVLGLDRGGSCRGMAYRVAAENRQAVLDWRELVLQRREAYVKALQEQLESMEHRALGAGQALKPGEVLTFAASGFVFRW